MNPPPRRRELTGRAVPKPPRAPKTDKQFYVNRSRWFGAAVTFLFVCLVTRLWILQIVQADQFRDAADANQIRWIGSRAPRGTIVDRNGALLAGNRPQFAVYVTPDIVKNPVVLGRLAELLNVKQGDLAAAIRTSQQNPYDPLRVALDVPIRTITRIEEDRPFLPGVSTAPEPVRWYPDDDTAAHLLGTMGRIDPSEFRRMKVEGYFNDDFVGKTGIERQYEAALHGKPGGIQVQIDARGRRIKTLDTQQPEPGGTVHLALDLAVQRAAEEAYQSREYKGAAVAIDPRTGAVIAMVSEPSFDPNAFATGIDQSQWAPLNHDVNKPLLDRSSNAMYPPGSTFKPIVASAGLQTGAITTRTSTYCPGYYYLGNARFGCWQVHGHVDFYKAIEDSCDVFFYMTGQRIGPERMSEYAQAFGFSQKTGIDLPGEDIGSIPSPAWKARHFARLGPAFTKWYGGDTLHMAIGQGDVLVTPLQMARAVAAIANGGDVLRPYVVDRITDPLTGSTRFFKKREVVRHVPVSAANLDAVRDAMRLTVTSGTGRVVDLPNVAVAAKTGSAQVHGSAKTHGWFICFAPMDHPTIAIAAVVEHGGHGADSAGKVARAMLMTYFHIKNTTESDAKSD